MLPARRNALLWLLAAIAFLVAGLLTPKRQVSFFAVALLDFAVCIITLRRGNSPGRPVQ
jgi:membrane protein implicated in regulation of membrane protease activity